MSDARSKLRPIITEFFLAASRCGSKYRCQVVSSAFAGKSRLECHRMVHEAVGEEDMAAIHAFSVKTFTPEKWEEQKNK